MSGEEQEAGDEIFATAIYEAASPTKRDFESWHRPRKQFVRREQWLHQIRELVDGQPADRPLRYLGLPGPDLLDIRLFYAELCSTRQLRFLGFNTAAAGHGPDQIDLNISLEEVRALDNMDPLSHVVPDDFRTLARADSMGWKSAVEAGPFDVVNLDLCDNFLSDQIADKSIYSAIGRLFGLQKKSMQPWLLLLTTRVDRATVDVGVLESLSEALSRNLLECQPFNDALRELTATTGEDHAPGLDTCGDDQWINVVGTAIAKWVLSMSISAEMGFSFKSCMSYRVNHGEGPDDLLSIAVRLTPTVSHVTDPSGLAVVAAGTSADECKEATKIPPRLGRLVPVDAALDADNELAQTLVEETAALLVQARYSRDDYLAWVAS